MRCENCQNELEPGVLFCGECGHPVTESIADPHCAKCGEELVPGDIFCGNCGHRVGEAAAIPPAEATEMSTLAQDRPRDEDAPAESAALATQIGPPKESTALETRIGQAEPSPAASVPTIQPAQPRPVQPPPPPYRPPAAQSPPAAEPPSAALPPPPSQPPPAQPPAYNAPPPRPAQTAAPAGGQSFISKNRTWLTFGGIGCLVILCFGAIVVLGIFYQQSQEDNLAQNTTPLSFPYPQPRKMKLSLTR